MAKIKIMVASTVYNFEDQILQIYAVLNGFGYDVWNSHTGTIPVHPGRSNLENCVQAAQDCDVFLGIVRPFYGSGVVGNKSITHAEFSKAVELNKPRWLLVHRDVTFSRKLLKRHMYTSKGKRTAFKLKKNNVMDDLRVIDLYEEATQADTPMLERTGHWVQEYYRVSEALAYIDTQLKDVKSVRSICKGMRI